MKKLKIEQTSRGFNRANFVDKYGIVCSLQESSAADEPCIWLGCNEPNPKQLRYGGWRDYELPKDVECTTRMHLTREHVKALLPHLIKFVETGEIE